MCRLAHFVFQEGSNGMSVRAEGIHIRGDCLRAVMLCFQDICPGSDEVIIVTSSLMKDMNSKVELYRCAQPPQHHGIISTTASASDNTSANSQHVCRSCNPVFALQLWPPVLTDLALPALPSVPLMPSGLTALDGTARNTKYGQTTA